MKKKESPETRKTRTYRTTKASDYKKKISTEDEKKIIQAIISENTILETDTEEQKRKKEEVNQNFKLFGLELALPVYKKRNQNKDPEQIKMPAKLRHLTLDDIPQLLDATKYSYKDLFEIVLGNEGERASIGWYSETAAKMANICDALSEEMRKTILEKVNSLVPPVFFEMCKATDQPLIRAFRIAVAQQTYSGEIYKKTFSNENYNNYMSQRIRRRTDDTKPEKDYKLGTLSEYYNICALYSLSIHLVMGLDETRCVLAQNGTTELIMDAFCLLPAETQKALANSLMMIE